MTGFYRKCNTGVKLVKFILRIKKTKKNHVFLCTLPSKLPNMEEAYSKPCQTSKMEHFAKIVNGLVSS